MANPGYVRSSDGNDADDGSTWALANATLTGAMTDAAAGDRIWISDNHSETTAGNVTISCPGTLAAPCQLLCGDDAAEPPTALATTGQFASTGTTTWSFTGSFYLYGLIAAIGSVGSIGSFRPCQAANNMQVFERLTYRNNSTLSPSMLIGVNSGSGGQKCVFIDSTFRCAQAGHALTVLCKLEIRGGSWESGGTNPTAIFTLDAAQSNTLSILVDGFDFSALSTTFDFFSGTSQDLTGTAVIRNCKLPASWAGDLFGGTLTSMGCRFEMFNCSSGDTNYNLWVEDYSGTIKHETTIVRSGGASDGTTSLAWKMVTSANAEYPTIILRSPEIVRWNETLSSITVTVEIVHDSQGSGTSSAFTDKEIWLEVQYLGTSGFPLSVFIDDAAADILATAADQTSSSETWTTTGLTTPVKQKLSVTFTPAEKGYIHAVVCMAGASDTAYICPKLTVA